MKIPDHWPAKARPTTLLFVDREVDYRDEAVLFFRSGLGAGAVGKFAVEGAEEILNLMLHLGHFLAHVENNFDARQVDAQVASEVENDFEPLQIVVGIQAGVAVTTRRLQQTFPLLEPESLRVKAVLFGH